MNRTLFLTLIRNRLSSPARVVALVVPALWASIAAAMMHSLSPLASLGGYYAVVAAAGGIGQDVASGTLQLVLARPITRPGYVLSRWVAASALATAWNLATVVGGAALLAANGTPPDLGLLGRMAAEGALAAFGAAAVMLMFSSLVGGFGDVGLLIGAYFATSAFSAVTQHYGWITVSNVLNTVNASLAPTVALDGFAQGTAPWTALTAWASTVTLALFLAIVRVNHRELSYAGSG